MSMFVVRRYRSSLRQRLESVIPKEGFGFLIAEKRMEIDLVEDLDFESMTKILLSYLNNIACLRHYYPIHYPQKSLLPEHARSSSVRNHMKLALPLLRLTICSRSVYMTCCADV